MVDTQDIITEEVVRDIIEAKQRETRQARRAFRSHDATNISSNSFEFPKADADFEGESAEIPEGSAYPRASKSYDGVQAAYSKFGFEVPITDEAVDDSTIDIELDAMEDMADEEFRRMDSIAFGILNNNTNDDGPVSESATDGVIEDADLLKAREILFADDFALRNMELYVGPSGMTDVTSMNQFLDAFEITDTMLEQGYLPREDIGQGLVGVARGIPIYAMNTGDLGEGEALLVDTASYGYESTRWDQEVNSYREENKDQTVHKTRSREDWVATDPEACVKIAT